MSLWIACSDWEILQSATRLRHSGLGVAPDSASFMEHEDRTGAYGQSRTGARTEQQDWSTRAHTEGSKKRPGHYGFVSYVARRWDLTNPSEDLPRTNRASLGVALRCCLDERGLGCGCGSLA